MPLTSNTVWKPVSPRTYGEPWPCDVFCTATPAVSSRASGSVRAICRERSSSRPTHGGAVGQVGERLGYGGGGDDDRLSDARDTGSGAGKQVASTAFQPAPRLPSGRTSRLRPRTAPGVNRERGGRGVRKPPQETCLVTMRGPFASGRATKAHRSFCCQTLLTIGPLL